MLSRNVVKINVVFDVINYNYLQTFGCSRNKVRKMYRVLTAYDYDIKCAYVYEKVYNKELKI